MSQLRVIRGNLAETAPPPVVAAERWLTADVMLVLVAASTWGFAFSTRARPGAPVSVPLAWDELEPRLRPDRYTVRSVPDRVRRLVRDPWAPYWRCRQRVAANARAALAAL